MKINKVLVLSSTLFLVACNKNPYAPTTKKIDNEQALTRTKEILEHQNDTSFVWPNKCSISTKSEGYEKNIEEGVEEVINQTLSTKTSLDLDNLMYASDTTSVTKSETYKSESYEFWKDNIYYVLTNENGEKSRTEESIDKNSAKQKMEEKYDEDFKDEITGKYELENFPTIQKEDEENKKKAEETSSYDYNYQYGSNNNKSFERTMNYKREEKNTAEFKRQLYISKYRTLWAEDLQKTNLIYYHDEEEPIGAEYSSFTEESEIQIDYSYNNEVKIQLPNINDYPLQEK